MNQLVTFQTMIPAVQWNEQLILMVLEQIKKDFALQGYALVSEPYEFSDFYTELLNQLQIFVNQDMHGLSSMLYRIDVSENQVAVALAESNENAEIVLFKLIIDRELKKVRSRLKWSENH